MDQSQKTQLVKLLLGEEALKFGQFTTKSGRNSPYFIDFGRVYYGNALNLLAEFFASFISHNFRGKVDNIFGPSYKGIPLAVAIVQKLASDFDLNLSYTFNRKEKKDHGEKGTLVGCQYQEKQRVLIVDDVLTGGTSMRESFDTLSSQNVDIIGSLVAVDRMEKGRNEELASDEIRSTYKTNVYSLCNIKDIVNCVRADETLNKLWMTPQIEQSIKSYQEQYGSAE